tara:strand:+ start:524 stop:1732 length:1209 start_codon:yes stop_codon:yes gene_type:complete
MIPRTRTLEVELSTKCTLSCSECPRVIHKSTISDWNYGFLKTKPFLDNVDSHILEYIFSGAYGDPIYHPDFADILHTLVNRSNNPRIKIETNGGYISEEKYHNIGKAVSSNPNNRVIFTMSVDGSLDNFIQYRINGDRKGTEAGLRILPEYGVYVNWKFISFEYNTNFETLKKVYDTANSYGVQRITLIHSHRARPGDYVSVEQFIKAVDQLYQYSKNLQSNHKTIISLGVAPGYRSEFPECYPITSHPLWPDSKVIIKTNSVSNNLAIKNNNGAKIREIIDPATTKGFNNKPSTTSPKWRNKILPQCVYKKHQNFIGADGVYLPCCWLHADGPAMKQHIKNLIGGSFKELSIYNYSFDEIVNSESWKRLSDNFTNIKVCHTKCPSESRMPTIDKSKGLATV